MMGSCREFSILKQDGSSLKNEVSSVSEKTAGSKTSNEMNSRKRRGKTKQDRLNSSKGVDDGNVKRKTDESVKQRTNQKAPKDYIDVHSKEQKMKKETCKVCGKEFRSRNSLYGHMKCHSDRNWRGVSPPRSPRPPRPPRRRRALMGWAMKGKRGRKSISKPELKDECVYYLMMMAREGLLDAKIQRLGVNIDQSQSPATLLMPRVMKIN